MKIPPFGFPPTGTTTLLSNPNGLKSYGLAGKYACFRVGFGKDKAGALSFIFSLSICISGILCSITDAIPTTVAPMDIKPPIISPGPGKGESICDIPPANAYTGLKLLNTFPTVLKLSKRKNCQRDHIY